MKSLCTYTIILVFAAGLSGAAHAGEKAIVLKPGTPMTALETPEGAEGCEAWAVNSRDEISGFCVYDQDFYLPTPVLWIGGGAVALDGPILVAQAGGSTDEFPLESGIAAGINDSGTIAGSITSGLLRRAATWDEGSGSWRALPVPAPSTNAIARGINAHGDVIGTVAGPLGGFAVIWMDGAPKVLDRPADAVGCLGYAINNAREVTGFCITEEGADLVQYAVFWDGEGHASLISDGLPLGDPSLDEYSSSFGRAINASGAIAGTAANAATLWAGATALVLDDPGVANGINERGDAAGYVGINGGMGADAPRARFWRAGASAGVDLGTLGGDTSFARAISDRGVVVGFSADAGGVTRAFALRVK